MTDTSERKRLLQALLRSSFAAFVEKVFMTISPARVYRHNWHIEAIAHQLHEVAAGRCRRLIITIPPRNLKSTIASVAFPAWLLGHHPGLRIIGVTYGSELSRAQQNEFRAVVQSEWYRELFPETRIDVRKDTEQEVRTTRRGVRYATTVGGVLTGRGGDIIIIDDPLKASDACSEAARSGVNSWYGETLVSRHDNKLTGITIVVMQRLHDDDLVGFLLREGGDDWVHLDLPAIAGEEAFIPVGQGRFHHRRVGDILNPAHEPLAVLDELRRSMGSELFEAQYQQRPVPPGGAMFKREWLRLRRPPWVDQPEEQIISIDTASKGHDRADYSVATVWAAKGEAMHLFHVERARLEYPDLRRMVIGLKQRWPRAVVLVEDAGVGTGLIADLERSHIGVISIMPDRDKVSRAAAETAFFEGGSVSVEPDAPWLGDYLAEMLAFPGGRHDDQVDSTAQAVHWWRGQIAGRGQWIVMDM